MRCLTLSVLVEHRLVFFYWQSEDSPYKQIAKIPEFEPVGRSASSLDSDNTTDDENDEKMENVFEKRLTPVVLSGKIKIQG